MEHRSETGNAVQERSLTRPGPDATVYPSSLALHQELEQMTSQLAYKILLQVLLLPGSTMSPSVQSDSSTRRRTTRGTISDIPPRLPLLHNIFRLACDQCRKTKSRCEHLSQSQEPCRNCLISGASTCSLRSLAVLTLIRPQIVLFWVSLEVTSSLLRLLTCSLHQNPVINEDLQKGLLTLIMCY